MKLCSVVNFILKFHCLLIFLFYHFTVYEIQRKYVEQEFVVSKPFVYFVMDIHTKVSLIAGVITDPLASPIWI